MQHVGGAQSCCHSIQFTILIQHQTFSFCHYWRRILCRITILFFADANPEISNPPMYHLPPSWYCSIIQPVIFQGRIFLVYSSCGAQRHGAVLNPFPTSKDGLRWGFWFFPCPSLKCSWKQKRQIKSWQDPAVLLLCFLKNFSMVI